MTDRSSPRRTEPTDETVLQLPDGTPVTLVQPNGTTRPVLGTREPAGDNAPARRARVLAAWGIAPRGPRQPIADAIEEPLPLRTRTALAYELPPDVAAKLKARG
ncbi:hypothetical protein [Paraburkholderia humisilvae]|uniref:Uncharacterized protein n=1 Tax=Paraburkholderia humisilvae TaxID=627669 RepID=A0A6J5EVE7_9BURK|nr:hypothetical protein [Paraburkholderia humisilvae]CAB3770183.1 hypothetical protein LMG29542_06292 [Paraburkholderia humisilvae]